MIDEIVALCPGFVATGTLRARKSRLVTGVVDGRAVVAKHVDGAVWRWYFAHEVAVYRAAPPGAPVLVAANEAWLIVERVAGAPLATRRRPHAELDEATLRSLLALRERIAASALPDPATPSAAVRGQLRERLLEQPGAPRWCHDGLVRAARRGLVEPDVAARLADATGDATATCHGDLLLRNVLPGPVLVDWECAGTHPRDWDLGLLWTQLGPNARATLERLAGRAFLPLAAWALVRELSYARTPDARLRAELEAVVRRIDAK